ncbi:MAG: hypothetical protein INQ03_08165 [Candidatus Heimdallarchaeota archaeon]|nr:hypothetical protein [Candidatus Heimdallarchaeota archaeon]
MLIRVFRVDKYGTEAAAASFAMMAAGGPYIPPMEVKINRPFIYMIYDNQLELIYFLGQVRNPSISPKNAGPPRLD